MENIQVLLSKISNTDVLTSVALSQSTISRAAQQFLEAQAALQRQ